jgi:hypothetical protein
MKSNHFLRLSNVLLLDTETEMESENNSRIKWSRAPWSPSEKSVSYEEEYNKSKLEAWPGQA